MNTTTAEKTVLHLQRTFPSPRERVFAAWTEPQQIKQWFGPEGSQIADVSVDMRVGGEYRIVFQSEKYGVMAVRGAYREITPPSRLAYTWVWEDDEAYVDRESLVTIEFRDLGDSTEVRLTHENLPSAESVGNHEHGWNGALDKLGTFLNA